MNRRSRMLVIRAPNGSLTDLEIDLTDIDNADHRTPFSVEILVECDLGNWHSESRVGILPVWSPES